MFSRFSFFFDGIFLLEACSSSMRGVLPLVEYVSYVVPYCVYLYTVCHPITIVINVKAEYTLSSLGIFNKQFVCFIHCTHFSCVFHL